MLSSLLRALLIILAILAVFIVGFVFSHGSLLIAFIAAAHPALCIAAGFYGGKLGILNVIVHLALLHFGWWFTALSPLHSGWWGVLIISIPTIALFWAGLIGFSLFVLPLPPSEWDNAAKTLIGFVTGYHYAYHHANNEMEELLPGKLMRKGQCPGLIISKAHTAVPVSTGTGFSCVAGPGITFIGRAERPHQNQVMDLRVQMRSGKVLATTRDGIEVEFFLPVIFRIEQLPPARPPVNITAYSESAVFNAVIAQRTTKSEELKWDEIPLELAKNHARAVISEYLLDRLLEDEMQAQQSAHDPMEQTAERRKRLFDEHRATMPRQVIREEIQKRLEAEIAGHVIGEDGKPQLDVVRKRYGIKIIGCGLGNLEVAGAKDEERAKAKEKPKTEEEKKLKARIEQADRLRNEILAQRMMSWQAEWLAESVRRRAQSDAEAAREIGRARAQSQMRMIQALTEGFEQAKAAGLQAHANVVVLLRLLDAIEEMAQAPGTREHVPEETLHSQAVMKRAALRAAGH